MTTNNNITIPCIDTQPAYLETGFKNSSITKKASDQLAAKALLITKEANIGIWEYVFDQKKLIAEDIFLTHLGITTPGFAGNYKTLVGFVYPGDKQRVRTEIKQALRNKANISIDCRIIWADQSIHHIQVNAIFQFDISGNPCSIIGSSRDITTQKMAASALLESEAKFRSFYENLPDGLLLTVTDGNIIAANPAAEKMFNMSEQEICHAGRFGLVDLADPRVEILIQERALNGRAKGEITCIRKDGTKFPTEITSVVFEDACGQNRTSMMIRDLSENHKVEKNLYATTHALQHALNDLNKIMDSSLDIICAINEQGKFVSISSAAERILGYTPAELINTCFIDFVAAEDVEKTMEEEVKIKNGESVTMFENRYIHKGGHIVPLLWSARWDDTNKLMYCIAKDATEKKILEKAVEVERQRFLALYAHAPSCMGVLKGPNHVYEMANPLYLQFICKKNIIGKTVQEVLPELEAQGVIGFLDDVYKTGKTFSANEMLMKFDFEGNGQLVDTYLNFIYQAHRDNENNIDGILFFGIDVTEQVKSRKKIEESEKQYRQIVETAQEGIWLIDEKNRTTFVNKKLCEIFEYSQEEMIGKDIFYFMDDEGKELAARMMEDKKDGVSSQNIFKYIGKSGKEIWTNLSSNPLFNDDNTYTGALAMITDITNTIILERQLFDEQIEKQIEISKAAINAQEKERTEIGQELHDNVNQLLATTKLYLGHLVNKYEGDTTTLIKCYEYLSTAIEEIRKLTKALVGPSSENEMGLIDSIKERITDIILLKEIEIEFNHDTYSEQDSEDGLKLVMYRVVQEQLSNILKHSDATNIAINIKNEHRCISLLINDNGKGFDTSACRDGIGLKNMKHRAAVYNGDVNITSSPGKGCAVSVVFPHSQ